jgi:hypothetical protein
MTEEEFQAIEEWRAIPGFSNYEVSKYGQIRYRHTQKIRKPQMRGNYLVLVIRNDGERKKAICSIHLAVLTAFVGPRPNGREGRHLDDNKMNNRLTNLAWGTRRDNVEDGLRNGRFFRGRNPPQKPAYYDGDQQGEKWATIPGMSNYKVSNQGRLRNLTTNNIKAPTRRHGHFIWSNLKWDEGREKNKMVAHCVLEAFVGPRQSKQEARHLYDGKANNWLSNLAWGTHDEVMQDARKRGI